jgi:Ras-related protein Rab-1A
MSYQDYDYIFKILLIGDSFVGKSSILIRYADKIFDQEFDTTIGVDFRIKMLDIEDKKVKLQIWDSAGQDRFRSIVSSYYRNCQGIIMVFDVSNRDSFSNIKDWWEEIKKYANENVRLILVGNKNDLYEKKISYEEAKEFADMLNIKYIETSVKNNKNIDEIFYEISKEIKENYRYIEPFKQLDTIKLESNKIRNFCTCENKCF